MQKDIYKKGYQYQDDCFFKLPQEKFSGKLFDEKSSIEEVLVEHKETYNKDLKV